eukprot:3952346-Heterocapsa_arctica.AAC.1
MIPNGKMAARRASMAGPLRCPWAPWTSTTQWTCTRPSGGTGPSCSPGTRPGRGPLLQGQRGGGAKRRPGSSWTHWSCPAPS